MAGRARPWRSWLAMSRFWWGHRRDPGFRFIRADLAYGYWCEQHGAMVAYTGGRGAELDAQLTQAAGLVADISVAKVARKFGG
jgi:hypothetical protein